MLDWSHKGITNDDMDLLLKALPGNTTTTEIMLAGNREVTDAHIDQLGAIIGPRRGSCNPCADPPSAVRSVRLVSTGVSLAKASWIARQIDLRRLSQSELKEINWSNGDATDNDVAELIDALREGGKGCSVTKVDLQNNADVTDRTGNALLDLLHGQRGCCGADAHQLAAVLLDGTGIDADLQARVALAAHDSVLQPVVDRVRRNDSSLRTVDWSARNVSTVDMDRLIGALPHNDHVTNIQL